MTDEHFTFLMSTYDISRARQLVRDRQPDNWVSVPEYYEGIIRPGIVQVDEIFARGGAVRIGEPLIVGSFVDGTTLVLDGYHRIARAYFEGRRWLPCYTLTVEETDQIRMWDLAPILCPYARRPLPSSLPLGEEAGPPASEAGDWPDGGGSWPAPPSRGA